MKSGWFLSSAFLFCISTGTAFAKESTLPKGREAVVEYFRHLTALTNRVNENETDEQGLLNWSNAVPLKKINQSTYLMHYYTLQAEALKTPPQCQGAQSMLLKLLELQDECFQAQYLLLRQHYVPNAHLSSSETKRVAYFSFHEDSDYQKTFDYQHQLDSLLGTLESKFHVPFNYGSQLEIFL